MESQAQMLRPAQVAGGVLVCKLWGQEVDMMETLRTLWTGSDGQDIAEYAVMLAVILVIVIGTIRLIGTNANTVFSSVASSIQQ